MTWPAFDSDSETNDDSPSPIVVDIESNELPCAYANPSFNPDPAKTAIPPRDSLFEIIVDSNEQLNYTFENIIGDTIDGFTPIRVRRIRKRLVVGDYAINGLPGIAIERKSKSDLFSSISSTDKRDNFLGRLRKMSTRLRYGAVVIECEAADIFDNPPQYTSFSPSKLYRTILSWQEKFPLVHWHWCRDRDFAEATTFRLLEKFYEDEMELRHQTDNNIINNHIQAFRDAIVARKSFDVHPVPYGIGNPIRASWLRGWAFFSIHFLGGELGTIHETDNPPPLPTESKPKKSRKKKAATNPMGELTEIAQRGFKF